MPKITVQVGGDQDQEPVEFELIGTDHTGKAIQPITFPCHRQVQGVDMLRIFSENEFVAGKEAFALIERAILPEFLELWKEVTTSDTIIVHMTALLEIAKGLLEVYFKSPLKGSGGSSAGSTPTAPTSMADYLSAPEPTLRPSVVTVSSAPPTQ